MMGESWLYNQQYWVSNHVQSTPWKPEFSRMATWNASMFQKKLYNPQLNMKSLDINRGLLNVFVTFFVHCQSIFKRWDFNDHFSHGI